jgi:hypothetical protein
VPLGLRARGDARSPDNGCRGDGRVVDDAVHHHLGHLIRDLDGIGGHLRDLPGELVLSLQGLFALVDADGVQLHAVPL